MMVLSVDKGEILSFYTKFLSLIKFFSIRYFKCSPNHGLFVPIAKVDISPLSKKLRRQNSQESLLSNITLGSLQSTTTSKLRMNAMQKVPVA